ncbi:MAG: biopolymer transporter ExbB [Rhodothalassiaceae bacterium]|nr:MAG: biopolymer transporter ExbB [Rhodothalassiaceae bacterium]
MTMKKTMISLGLFAAALIASPALAQESGGQADRPQTETAKPADLDALLQLVEQGQLTENRLHRQREAEFKARRDQQARLLREAEAERDREAARATQLERQIQQNEERLRDLQRTLQERLGELKEMFGVIQQVAGDVRGQVESSLISVETGRDARVPALDNLIQKASSSSSLPSIDEIRVLWTEMMREMVKSREVAKFPHTVITAAGDKKTVDLVRVGNFNLVSDDQGVYYKYDSENDKVVELPKQPSSRFTATAAALAEAQPGEVVGFGIDPTRGQLLSMFVQAPSLRERIDQGGVIGYVTIALGIFGVLLAIYKMIALAIVNAKVRAQMKAETASDGNPLGRVLKVYEENRNVDVETLELKLDEAILRETPALERGLTMIKLISAVAPLLGLLGTVTGMIATFQAITLFGTGDPKLMANGISQALVTTVIGLVVAIPTLLLHSFVSGMAQRVIHVLEEQSAGLVALHAEKEHGGASAA